MRILLASNSPYYPSLGGGNKSNRLLMQALAARGHQVLVVTRTSDFGETPHKNLLNQLAALQCIAIEGPRDIQVSVGGISIHTLTRDSSVRSYFAGKIEAFDPDIVLTSTDDTAHVMFSVALRAERVRVVYLIRATVALPFGPDSPLPSAALTQALGNADGVLAVSEYVARYARQWGNLDALHVPISLLEPGEWPRLGSYGNPFVTMINPCAVKGISIFLALADSFPDIRFAAVPAWGTTQPDLFAMRQRHNITLLPAVENIDEIYRQTRASIVPSIWAEARSRVILEAMSRGIPVLASNVGGLAEAMLGAGYLLPVTPVTEYKNAVDELLVPVAGIPPQDIGPWRAALKDLLSSRERYDTVADECRRAALHYKEKLHVGPLEEYLLNLLKAPQRPRTKIAVAGRPPLSGDRRKLLALRMRQKSTPEQIE